MNKNVENKILIQALYPPIKAKENLKKSHATVPSSKDERNVCVSSCTMPGACLSRQERVASGVTSLGEKPVPPAIHQSNFPLFADYFRGSRSLVAIAAKTGS